MRNKGILMLCVFLCVGMMSSCGKKEIEISWAVYDFEVPPNMEKDFNAELKEKGLPYRVEFLNIKPSELYLENRKLYLEGCGEALETGEYDIVGFPMQYDVYDYYGIFADAGLLEPLDSYMQEEGPLYETSPEPFQEVMKINGSCYGLLNHWGNYKKYFVFNVRYLEKYEIDPGESVTMEEVASWIRIVAEGEEKEGEKGFYIGDIGEPFRYKGYEDTLCPAVSIDTTGQELTAYSNLEIPVFQERMRLWDELADYGACRQVPQNSYQKGMFFLEIGYTYSAEAAVNNVYTGCGVERSVPLRAVECPEGNNPVSGWGCVTAIPAGSSHKKEAAELLGAVYSDRELSDCLAFGVEGSDYRKENGIIIPNDNMNLMRKMYFGNNLITSPDISDSGEKTKDLMEILNTFPVSQLAGYVFDCNPIEKEMDRVLTVYNENYPILFEQDGDFEIKLKDFQKKLEDAGISQIIDEINRQLKAFQSS